jgi:alcohol dehydrogenase class IV
MTPNMSESNEKAVSTLTGERAPSGRRLILAFATGMVASAAGLGLIPSITHQLGPTQIAMHAAIGGRSRPPPTRPP